MNLLKLLVRTLVPICVSLTKFLELHAQEFATVDDNVAHRNMVTVEEQILDGLCDVFRHSHLSNWYTGPKGVEASLSQIID